MSFARRFSWVYLLTFLPFHQVLLSVFKHLWKFQHTQITLYNCKIFISIWCYLPLGFAKAFDSVNHKFRLAKMKSFGLGDVVVRWIEANLSGRVSRVHVGAEHSGAIPVLSGVPHFGSTILTKTSTGSWSFPTIPVDHWMIRRRYHWQLRIVCLKEMHD